MRVARRAPGQLLRDSGWCLYELLHSMVVHIYNFMRNSPNELQIHRDNFGTIIGLGGGSPVVAASVGNSPRSNLRASDIETLY